MRAVDTPPHENEKTQILNDCSYPLSLGSSSLRDFYANGYNHELAKWVKIRTDDSVIQALISCNYTLSTNTVENKFSSQNIHVSPLKISDIKFDNSVSTIIDSSIVSGSGTAAILSDETSNYLIFDVDKIQRKTKAEIIDLQEFPTYKAKVVFVSPERRKEDYSNILHPFLGVSLQNSNFVRPKLLALLEWVCNRFKQCSVLVGDSIHRLTLMAEDDKLSEYEALELAINLGAKFIREEKHNFERFYQRCSFKFILCSEVQKFPDYKHYHSILKNLFEHDIKFQESILSFSKQYHSKRKEHLSEQHLNRLISNSCDYFLEEFAIFSCLKKRGRDLMIYPGSFSTLTEISEGVHQNVLQELKDLVIASLHIKKR